MRSAWRVRGTQRHHLRPSPLASQTKNRGEKRPDCGVRQLVSFFKVAPLMVKGPAACGADTSAAASPAPCPDADAHTAGPYNAANTPTGQNAPRTPARTHNTSASPAVTAEQR
jgi:hypothetical protein